MPLTHALSRRDFFKDSSAVAGGLLFGKQAAFASRALAEQERTKVSAHLWVYASAHPPDWDATPDLERAFGDVQYGGFDGVELMAVNLRHDYAVERISKLSQRFHLPITGTSLSAPMWNPSKHDETLRDAELVIQRLAELKGSTLGLSVGDAKHPKTDAEFDSQASVLRGITKLCELHGIQPNLHNHTYEVANDLRDLKGTLARLPKFKLGPDLNWLIRGGVDPVTFINTYGNQIVYMHIRDQYANGVWTEAVGEGVTDFPAIAENLRAQNFHGRAAVELAFPDKFIPGRPLKETWKMSREYVRHTFGW